MTLIHGIMERRKVAGKDRQSLIARPLFVWEPVPDLCTPEHIDSFRQAIRQVDVVSPNSEELAGFFAGQCKSLEDMASDVIEWGIGPSIRGSLVVRQGKDGCSAFSKGHCIHLPAYYTQDAESQSKVVDPTGGGNAFLGALAMALSGAVCPQIGEVNWLLGLDNDPTSESLPRLTLSLVYATVAASFVIEQPGMPVCHVRGDAKETWNRECFGSRLEAYLTREAAHLRTQVNNELRRTMEV
jgi:sugar/nucleoside kinase (ribokinase family)